MSKIGRNTYGNVKTISIQTRHKRRIYWREIRIIVLFISNIKQILSPSKVDDVTPLKRFIRYIIWYPAHINSKDTLCFRGMYFHFFTLIAFDQDHLLNDFLLLLIWQLLLLTVLHVLCLDLFYVHLNTSIFSFT